MAKTAPKDEPAAPADGAPVATGSKKKKLILIVAIAVILAVAGGGAAFFLTKKPANTKEVKKAEKQAPPTFLPLENFIVNLQTDNGDKYLQTGITLQVRNEEQLTYYKANMPQLRSRILLLLASKSADDLLTSAGKQKLEEDLIKSVQQPYNHEEPTPKEAEDHKILGVFFTSFMIQ